MALEHVDITTSQKLDRSVYHPDIIHSTTKPVVNDNLDRTLHLSTLKTEKTNSKKMITNFKNENLPIISDSDEIETTEENENADINCSVDNKNQQIDTKKDIQKKDSDESFDYSSDLDRTLNLSILNTEKTNLRKMRNNYKNENLPKIFDSNEIETTEENEISDINCSDDDYNQEIDTKKEIKKTDLEASFDFSSDCVLLPTHSATDSSSTPNNKRDAMFLTFIGAGIIATMYVLNKLE